MTPKRPRILTGRQVLLLILLFFGIVALVNGTMIWLALSSHEAVSRQASPSGSGGAVQFVRGDYHG